MQTDRPTPADCRALRATLRASRTEIRERTRSGDRPGGYREDRISRVLNEKEASQPLVDSVWAALCEIRDERRARGSEIRAGGPLVAVDAPQ